MARNRLEGVPMGKSRLVLTQPPRDEPRIMCLTSCASFTGPCASLYGRLSPLSSPFRPCQVSGPTERPLCAASSHTVSLICRLLGFVVGLQPRRKAFRISMVSNPLPLSLWSQSLILDLWRRLFCDNHRFDRLTRRPWRHPRAHGQQ